MRITVSFFSYFKDLTGCAKIDLEMPEGSTLQDLLAHLSERFPKLQSMRKSTLAAVGVEYQTPAYALKAGDEVSLFPPVQGG